MLRHALSRILRGDPAWDDGGGPSATEILEAGESEGVHVLVARALSQDAGGRPRREEVRARFDAAVREALATELVARRELVELIGALRAEGIRPLLFKGAALAYTHYAFPAARPHIDVDLLVETAAVEPAAAVLQRAGYRRPLCTSGELIRSQVPYSRLDRYGVRHTIDLHWKVSMPQVFANLLPFDALAASAVPVPALGEGAEAVGPVHALAIACIHRVAHHHGRDRLIWLYDIHLLGGALGAAEAAQLVRLSARTRISAVCERGLSLAQQQFGTSLPPGLLTELSEAARAHTREASATYLRPHLRRVDVLRSDLAALDGWRQRVRLVSEHVFPPAAYMHEAYGVSGRALLPVLYAWRFVAGAGGWFRKGG